MGTLKVHLDLQNARKNGSSTADTLCFGILGHWILGTWKVQLHPESARLLAAEGFQGPAIEELEMAMRSGKGINPRGYSSKDPSFNVLGPKNHEP